MATFIKAQVASLSASVFDFLTTLVCTQYLHFWYVMGSATGTIVGGIINFAMGRHWVFGASKKKVHFQIMKYVLVWSGNLLLTTSGVFLVTHFLNINYIISKIIVTSTVGVTYNYLMQKKFVFA